MSSILDQDIMFLPGVGPKKKEILSKELGISSYGDLLEYYPYKYVDRSRIFHISELTPDMPYVQIKGRILSYEEFDTGKRNKRLVAHFSDGFGVVDLVWFRSSQYILKTYHVGTEYIVSANQPSLAAAISLPIQTWMMPATCRFQKWECNLSIIPPKR